MTHRTLPRTLSLALALAAASLSPLFLSGTALAAAPTDATAATKGDHAAAKGDHAAAKGDHAGAKGDHAGAKGDHAAAKSDGAASSKSVKHAAKPKTKAKKTAAAKPQASAKAHAKSDKASTKAVKAKRTAARENKSSAKRAKTPAKADSDSPKRGAAGADRCVGAPVSFDRGGVEAERLSLVDCAGKLLDSAIAKISILARPWGAPKRAVAKTGRIDGGVIARLEAIAKRFPGRTISLVGGPSQGASAGSAHQAGRAVDLSVDGVDNRKVVELCRTLADTGCGYYPNASFVHIDARAKGAGRAYWIDVSEPGEPPRYVTSWPPAQAGSRDNIAAK